MSNSRKKRSASGTGLIKKSKLIISILLIIIGFWNIVRIQVSYEVSVMGYISIIFPAVAILYIPLYLLLVRPRKTKINTKPIKNYATINSITHSVLWALVAVSLLWICYILWYILSSNDIIAVLRWEFLRGWSFNLLVFGAIIILIASIFFAKKVMICTVIGYVFGFVFALILNTDTFDPNPGIYVNNAWVIWTISYLIFIIAGIIWEIASG
ncbi:MAG: hypothetical protein FWC97_02280 [Treponema sp.]|nr:hypothetical protein [Treponema sp.]